MAFQQQIYRPHPRILNHPPLPLRAPPREQPVLRSRPRPQTGHQIPRHVQQQAPRPNTLLHVALRSPILLRQRRTLREAAA